MLRYRCFLLPTILIHAFDFGIVPTAWYVLHYIHITILLDSIIFSIRSPWIWLKWEPKDIYKYKSIACNVTSNILLSIFQWKHQSRIKNNVGIIPKSNFKIIKLIQTNLIYERIYVSIKQWGAFHRDFPYE
jgi:hypothetical protein